MLKVLFPYNETMVKLSFTFKALNGLFLLFSLVLGHSCFNSGDSQKSDKGAKEALAKWSPGDCIDKALSPYIYQIAQIEGSTVYLYRMGVMGKEIIKKSIEELKEGKEPYVKVPCP